MSSQAGKTKTDLEWEQRVLCSDESCIGTIGPDGRCRECGQPYEGQLPEGFGQPAEDGAETITSRQTDADQADESDADAADDDSDGTASVGDDEWSRRTLCSDESCIGVIGPDGKCKECGKPYAG